MSQAMSEAAKKRGGDLPAVKTGKGGRPPKGFAFTELIEKVGNETTNYHALELPKRELVVRIMYTLLLEGKYTFPDGREMVVETDRWLSLFWEIVKHVEVTSVNAFARTEGSLVGGGVVNTQVVLYLPNNQREVVGQLSSYVDGVTPRAIPDHAELSPATDDDDDEGELELPPDNTNGRRITIVNDDFSRADV